MPPRTLPSALLALALSSVALADTAAPPVVDRDAGSFRFDLTLDAWFPRLVGDIELGSASFGVEDLDLNSSEVTFAGDATIGWDRCFVDVSGFTFETDGTLPGLATQASWWDVSLDFGYALWRPFNDRPFPWSEPQSWPGNAAGDGGYRAELSLSPTLGLAYDDASLEVTGATGTAGVSGGWMTVRFGGQVDLRVHTRDLIGFIDSFDIAVSATYGPNFGVSGDADGTGNQWTVEAGIKILVTPNVGAHLGYRLIDADFKDSFGGTADAGLQGLVAGLAVEF